MTAPTTLVPARPPTTANRDGAHPHRRQHGDGREVRAPALRDRAADPARHHPGGRHRTASPPHRAAARRRPPVVHHLRDGGLRRPFRRRARHGAAGPGPRAARHPRRRTPVLSRHLPLRAGAPRPDAAGDRGRGGRAAPVPRRGRSDPAPGGRQDPRGAAGERAATGGHATAQRAEIGRRQGCEADAAGGLRALDELRRAVAEAEPERADARDAVVREAWAELLSGARRLTR